MSDAAMTAEPIVPDALKTAADAMAIAVRAAKEGAADARAKTSEVVPAVGRFLNRLTYTTFYTISYGVVFPSLLVAHWVPKENALVHGLIDGGWAARDAVTEMGKARESKGSEGDEPASVAGEDGPAAGE